MVPHNVWHAVIMVAIVAAVKLLLPGVQYLNVMKMVLLAKQYHVLVMTLAPCAKIEI